MRNEGNDLACHSIIYVRGYAMTRREQDETAADPSCCFKLGSTVYRSVIDKDAAVRTALKSGASRTARAV